MSCCFFFSHPPGSAAALLEGTLPLRYCAGRFACKIPTLRLPAAGRHAANLVTDGEWRTQGLQARQGRPRKQEQRHEVLLLVGPMFREMKDLGIALPSWHVLRLEDGRMKACGAVVHAQKMKCTGKKGPRTMTSKNKWKAIFVKRQDDSNLDCEACCTGKIVDHQRSVAAKKKLNDMCWECCQAETTENHRLHNCCDWRKKDTTCPLRNESREHWKSQR